MNWWLSFGLVWLFTAVSFWAFFRGAAMDPPPPSPSPDSPNQCAWCGGWLLTSAALLGDVDGVFITHGICGECADTMEEEGGLGADRVGQPGIRRSR